ncbi:MAG TPA: cyclopropane-fatty-acyl-phospholipid synthase family protein [Candidatus Acidoferrales bacterium]|nr:cyclopropane-fatty-acyl-phospholipid synthase family protein [Candidatus Acidoferrales bacterium]
MHPSTSSSFDTRLLKKTLAAIGNPPIRLNLGGRAEVSPPNARPIASVIFPDRRAVAKLLLDPEMAFGDGYSDGSIRVEGDLVQLMEIVSRAMNHAKRQGWYSKLESRWMSLVQPNTLRGSAKNIHHHYDLDVNFYKLWLDSQLVYTCAYFPTPGATLEEAQLAKMDHVCRKIQLQPGEKVVEAGCGWGALALHMARQFGANVRAYNVSAEQIAFARERAKQEGLAHQVEFIQDDYRNISGEYDAFVSVGMLEHVGPDHYGDLSRVIHRAIGNSGRGLLHFIGRNQPRLLSPWIRKHIFPGGHPPALSEVMNIFEPLDAAVLDVENLRFHYAKTLEHWLARYEKAGERISVMFGPEFLRTWRLYLAGSIAAFRTGSLQLFQIVFAGSECQRIPWTRAYLYQEGPPGRRLVEPGGSVPANGSPRYAGKETKWMHA